MPSSRDYLDYVLENLVLLDDISYKQMMGEYIIYYHNKIIGGIYDNRFLVKDTKSVYSLIKDVKKELPYEGAKPMILVEEIDDKDFLKELLNCIYNDLY